MEAGQGISGDPCAIACTYWASTKALIAIANAGSINANIMDD
jgi:hypothetical protein